MEELLGLILLVVLVVAVRTAWRDAAPPPGPGAAPRPPPHPGSPPRASERERLREQRQDEAFIDGLFIGGWYVSEHLHDDGEASDGRFCDDAYDDELDLYGDDDLWDDVGDDW